MGHLLISQTTPGQARPEQAIAAQRSVGGSRWKDNFKDALSMRAKRENHLAGSTIFGFYLAGQLATGPVQSGSESARTHSR